MAVTFYSRDRLILERAPKVIVVTRNSRNGLKRIRNSMVTKPADRGTARPRHESMPELADGTIKDMVKIFKLLSDETRLKILFFLTQVDELHVRALCELLGQSQPAVSHHLALLRVAGLIEPRREGKHNFYRLMTERFESLLDTLFASVPEGERRIRFENYVLSHTPVTDAV